MQKKFLTTSEITDLYGIDESTITALVDAGDLKALADRGTWKYRREEVEGLIRSGRLHATKELPVGGEELVDEELALAAEDAAPAGLDFLELDEPALAGGAPARPQSSSDVHVVVDSEPAASNHTSDSDVHLMRDSAPRATSPAAGAATLFEMPAADEELAPTSPAAPVTEEINLGLGAGAGGSLWEEEAAPAQPAPGDSGISLASGDSGISLEKEDSGISLVAEDSGISLSDEDSGLKLAGEDSGIPLKFADEEPAVAPTILSTPTADSDTGLADLNLSGDTSELDIDAEAPQAKKKPKGRTPLSLSEAAEAGATVEDLEVIDELDESTDEVDEEVLEDINEVAEEEEVLEASDEAFTEFETAEEELVEGEEEEYGAVSKPAAPREPSWGTMTAVVVLLAAVLLGANGWMLWEGMSTMWTGDEPSGPAASLISSLAGLF